LAAPASLLAVSGVDRSDPRYKAEATNRRCPVATRSDAPGVVAVLVDLDLGACPAHHIQGQRERREATDKRSDAQDAEYHRAGCGLDAHRWALQLER